MWQILIVSIVVLISACWLFRKLWKRVKGQDKCANCTGCKIDEEP